MAPQTEPKEWTLMFYFASDNPLAPGIVSQLKALKNAGYHRSVNVVAYFDPQTPGTPTHIFDVNAIEKVENDNPRIGFDRNPFVRNLFLDRLWGEEKDRNGQSIRKLIPELLVKPGRTLNLPTANGSRPENSGNSSDTDSGPADSLEAFLNLCATEENYQAKHYMLFILGHGLVVGDDVFLYDEHAARHSITLVELRGLLEGFKNKIPHSEFELVSFHCCSMSSLEVAFELKKTAKYMLASQGPAFVGSWPYTQILMRVFLDVENGKINTEKGVEKMVETIFDYVFHNSSDFMMAGYSFDLCLCDLRKINSLQRPIKDLSAALTEGLANPMVANCILLAHWKSQSYWQQNYTDLADFCFCLLGYCKQFATPDSSPYEQIMEKCETVIDAFKKQSYNNPDNPIISAEPAGPDSQYSTGLSIFFPWARPSSDRPIMKEKHHKTEYERYEFNQTGWFSFLNQYWGPKEAGEAVEGSTMRASHREEAAGASNKKVVPPARLSLELQRANLFRDMVSLMFDAGGTLNNDSALSEKVNPPDPTGDECTCGSIKNYRRDTRERLKRGQKAEHAVPGSSKVFSENKF